MSIFNTFWQRQKEIRGDIPDVYSYDDIPSPLRVQIVHIAAETLGSRKEFFFRQNENIQQAYGIIVDILRKEFGVFRLYGASSYREDKQQELFDFILKEQDVEKVLSAVELICRVIENNVVLYRYRYDNNSEAAAKDAIAEINARMRAAGFGYEYDGEIIRIDSELVHVETVKPALKLLRETRYAGPEQEFRAAYEHYRNGKNKEAVTEAAKAF